MMKIKKNKPAEAQVTAAAQSTEKKYVNATSHIEAAIKVLGSAADISTDATAKDAIANLSVILFDLKS